MKSYLPVRLRRNRVSNWMRSMIAETTLQPQDLIMPFFIIEGQNISQEIKELQGVYRLSIDLAIKQAMIARDLGISAIMLFPVIDQKLKSKNADEAFNENNIILRAVREIKKCVPEIGVICDVALDPYTLSGHDGITNDDNYVMNDETVDLLCKQALMQAFAGADIVAPSDMMDGRVQAIRECLDDNGFINVAIMSYSAKYASNFYGAFRYAVGSHKNLQNSDKKTYQIDFRNSKEALREIEQDITEGADIIIVKPASHYLDIIKEASLQFSVPIVAYQVSGEYAMLKFASMNDILNFEEAMFESLIACKRAGAKSIITYAAIDIAKYLNNVQMK